MALLIGDISGAEQLKAFAKSGLMIILHCNYLFCFVTSQVGAYLRNGIQVKLSIL